MRMFLVVAMIVVGLGGADACAQKEKLLLASNELMLIMADGAGQELGAYSYAALYRTMNELSKHPPYNKMLFNKDAFVKKATQRQKAAFAKKGLKFGGGDDDVVEELSNNIAALEHANKKCNTRQKRGQK